jgi:hypothetical protein
MRDVQRLSALPWFIYSLNNAASSRYRMRGSRDADVADEFFQLFDVQPRHALAHRA